MFCFSLLKLLIFFLNFLSFSVATSNEWQSLRCVCLIIKVIVVTLMKANVYLGSKQLLCYLINFHHFAAFSNLIFQLFCSCSGLTSTKLMMNRPQFGQSISQQGFFSASRESISPQCAARTSHTHVSATASEMDLSRKNRRIECGRLKAGDQSLLGPWNRTGARGSTAITLATMPSSNHLGSTAQQPPGGCNGSDQLVFISLLCSSSLCGVFVTLLILPYFPSICRLSRRSGGSLAPSGRQQQPSPMRWTFVFDPAGRLCYYWSMVVSLAFLYNFWVIIYRFAFQEINANTIIVWFCLDYFSDLLYLVDILFHFRTGYLEDGVLQTDSIKLRQYYINSTICYIDCLCLLPLDCLYLSIGFNSILRSFRLVKIYRFWAFMDRTERHTNYPNLFRSVALIHYLLVIFHWNGCLYHLIYKNNGFGSKTWVFSDAEAADVVKQYLQSYYWCTLALTTIGDLPRPRTKGEYVFVISQLLFGLMLFATVLGHVANIVTSVSAARKEFQGKLLSLIIFYYNLYMCDANYVYFVIFKWHWRLNSI